MPRPQIKPELLAQLEAKTDRQVERPEAIALIRVTGIQFVREMMMAANWLYHTLTDNGCEEKHARSICFLHGVRFVNEKRDPWDVAQDMFRRWKNGLTLNPQTEAN